MSSVGASPLQWLVVITLLSGGVFVIVRALDAGLVRVLGPRIRMTLYALVLLRVMLPLDVSTPLGMLGASEPETASTAALATELEAPVIEVPWLSRAQTQPSAAAVSTTESAASPVHWIYLAGVSILLGVAAMRRRHLARIVAQSRPATHALAEQGGSARVLVHPCAGPLAAGHRHKVIVLPQPLVDRLDGESLRWVVAHERAHHEGHDTWLATALTFATALAWPVLPVWLAAHRVRSLIEHAADERAVALVAGPRRSYGRVLLDLVAEAPTRRVTVGLGAYRDLRSRISAIIRPTRTPVAVQLFVATAIAGAVVACATMSTEEEPDEARELVCSDLIQRAMAAHDASERDRDAQQLELAIATYDDYIELCADTPGDVTSYGDMVYYAAEANWAAAFAANQAGQTDAAARGFNRARALFDLAIDAGTSRFTNDAAYAQYLSTRNALRWDGREDAEACEGCEPLAFVPYDAAESDVLAAWERLVDVRGRPTEAGADELFRLARLRMQHNDFAAARPDLEELVSTHPGTQPGLSGAEMLVDVLTIEWTRSGPQAQEAAATALAEWLGRIEESATWSMDGAARLRETAPALRAGIAWQAAMRQLAEAEASGDRDAYRRCAEQFESLAATYPDHAQVEAMRRNAATCAAAAG